MALYDGFFDAVVDESTGEYDRDYGPTDFTGYFANVIGSGVCIHDNPDSFKAEYENGVLYLRPGYLFIRGYWLANKPENGESNYKGYAVPLPSGMTGSMAVVAHLNLGQRLIEIEVRPVSQAYPDALVLAVVTASTAEDTRHNTDICGVIDTAGALSSKVEWALNYIDREIESKLQQVEADIAAQELKLNAKIAEVQAVADSIVPPPVGTIKFSAAQDVGPEWLRCNGDFISESQYPELVAALGKLTPSGDKFRLISDGEIGPQISNGVIYDGRMWVYSYSTKKLYGIDLEGAAAIKEILITSDDSLFDNFITPTTQRPLCLSIVPHKIGTGAKIFLTQIIRDGDLSAAAIKNLILVFSSEFLADENIAKLSDSFSKMQNTYDVNYNANSGVAVPYIRSDVEDGVEIYSCFFGYYSYNTTTSKDYSLLILKLGYDDNAAKVMRISKNDPPDFSYQRTAFLGKEKGEAIYIVFSASSTQYYVKSYPSGIFEADIRSESHISRNTYGPINVGGPTGVLFSFDKGAFNVAYIQKSAGSVITQESLSSARVFVDGAAYLWGKDIYMIFVGTGIIFSRTLEEGSFGYLDTTSVLGTITQFGYLDYSEDEGTLYLLGQDTSNRVKAAKIELNTLYDYANDGAWLPMIASDGVPAYIKAKEAET